MLSQRPALLMGCLALGLTAGGLGAAGAAQSSTRPNVVLCMADDQGWGDVGYNGHPVLKTPNLDAMARSGLRLDRFYAAAPVCSPTRGSVLTGRHPNRFGCFSWANTLRPQEVTVAEALKKAGYATGHFGKWHLGPVRAESPVCPGASGFDQWFSSPNFFENSPLMSRQGKVVQTEGEGSQVVVDAALGFIRAAAARKQPFLAVVWFGSPHSPHLAPDDLPGHAAWLEGDYKLHRLPGKAAPSYALFNLVVDPKEETDIAGREPQRVERMKAALDAWQRSVVGSLNGEDYRPRGP